MPRHDDDPYEFGDITTDGGLGDDDPPDGVAEGTDTVIVDGTAVSYRRYRTDADAE